MGGIGVISNPRSGKNRRNPQLARRLSYVLGAEVEQPDGLDSLDDVARDFRDRDIDVVCVHGGDGTLHKVLSALLRVYGEGLEGRALRQVRLPIIALLKGGTMNTLARNVGVKASAEDMLGHVVSAYHSAQPFRLAERNVMVVDGRHAGFLFGNGALSRFLEAYYEGGDASPWKGVKVLVRLIFSVLIGGAFSRWLFARDTCRVQVDGVDWEQHDFVAIAAGTAADLGFGFRPFYASRDHLDHVHVLGLGASPMGLLSRIHRIRLALPMKHPDIVDQVARRFTIRADGPQNFMLDGDFIEGGQTLSVEAGPRVRFVVR